MTCRPGMTGGSKLASDCAVVAVFRPADPPSTGRVGPISALVRRLREPWRPRLIDGVCVIPLACTCDRHHSEVIHRLCRGRLVTMDLHTRYLGFAPDLVGYTQAWDEQRRIHAAIVNGESPSTLLLLEHADVYTAGKRTEPQDRPTDGTPVIDVDRGGKITWHGEGQLVGYPLLHLRDRALVKDYVCALEGALMTVLAEDYGITTSRVDGRSGVWITGDGVDRKIAAIGIRVHHGVTLHGFALNCSNDLAPFSSIIPCGITDAATTTITRELGRTIKPIDVVDRVTEELLAVLPRYISRGDENPADQPQDHVSACTVSSAKKEVIS